VGASEAAAAETATSFAADIATVLPAFVPD